VTGMEGALKGMTRRQLEDLGDKIARELRACTLCGIEGASPFRVIATGGGLRGNKASLLLCMPCFEKHRLPEGRAEMSA
jgi:hypothetical protein